MLRSLGQLISLTCVATVLTLFLGVGFAWQQGKLSQDKLVKVAATFHNIEVSLQESKPAVIDSGTSEQPSYLEQDRLRMTVSKNIDLKTQSLDNGLSGLEFARRKLENDVTNFDRRLNAFEAELDKKQGTAKQKGYTHLRMIWEKMAPQDVKNHILNMVNEKQQIEEVVVLLSDMENDKRVKIFNRFSTVEKQELEVLSDILEKIRIGDPEGSLIRETQQQLRDGGGTQAP